MVKFRRATTEAEADGPFRYHKRKDVLSIDLQVLLLLVLGQFYDTGQADKLFHLLPYIDEEWSSDRMILLHIIYVILILLARTQREMGAQHPIPFL